MKKSFLISMMMAGCIYANASIVINELMPKNVSFQTDENLQFSGWAELYNNGASAEDISLYFFSDDIANKDQWQMFTDGKDLVLQPGEFALVYFDETDISEREKIKSALGFDLTYACHANFKLPAKRGCLYLFNESGNIVDQMAYDTTYRNISYGRIVDGGEKLGFFTQPTPKAPNASGSVATKKTNAPQFSLVPGFYNGEQRVSISAKDPNAKIYYTTDGTEPTNKSNLYNGNITINKNTPLRAIAVTNGEISSDVTTGTYFINENVNKLPIVSLVIDNKYIFGDTLGFLAIGINGGKVNSGCSPRFGESKANYMRDWDRPCNFELFDAKKKERLNQEVKVGAFGACSRTKPIKSIKVNTGKIYGNNQLDYPIFEEKPNLKWKSIVLRNAGNDYGRSYLRDGFIQSLLIGQADIDHQAYQPSMVFINGEFYAMLNIRERTNKDFIYSNYGLSEDEFYIVEGNKSNDKNNDSNYWESGYNELIAICEQPDMNTKEVFEGLDYRMDINEYLNYMMIEMYCGNSDWPGGNIKCWKAKGDASAKINGKWRWILYDTEFSYSLYNNTVRTNCFSKAKEHKLFNPLMKNDKIREMLLAKFCVHLATTFEPTRVNHVLDSLIKNIQPDVERYYNKLNEARYLEKDFSQDISDIRSFANERVDVMYKNIKSNFKIDTIPFHIYSDVKDASFTINQEPIRLSDFRGYFFTHTNCNLSANEPAGYRFSHWEVTNKLTNETSKVYSIAFADTFANSTTIKAVYTEDADFNPNAPQIFFNELCASNSLFVDEYREADDWFELYNNGNKDFNLSGLFLSVDKDNLGKYQIPSSDSCIIKAKGYKSFWADNDPEQGVLHTNFKLPVTTATTLILSSAKINGKDTVFTIIDSVEYRMHKENESYARFGDYTAIGKQWKITGVPTYEKRNIYAVILDNPTVTIQNNIAQIYPNPVEDELFFSLPWEDEIEAVIITMSGQILKDFKIRDNQSINVSDLKKGMYILMMQTPEGKIAAKLIKQ